MRRRKIAPITPATLEKQVAAGDCICQASHVVLIIVHHHFRPGGVRRVIETATPHLVAHGASHISAVTLAGGESPDPVWLAGFRARLGNVRLDVMVRPEFGYLFESSLDKNFSARLGRALREMLECRRGDDRVVWAHNLGLGRNLYLARELRVTCERAGVMLVAHHHDWWFENRWHHYASFQKHSFRGLRAIAAATLANSPVIRHVAINRADATLLARHFGDRAGWLPNPVAETTPPSGQQTGRAREWLCRQLRERAPVWLMPCRLLRRKNVAEALLLTRWLRPEAWLVTTGGVSSAEEQAYADALSAAAQAHGWRLQLGLLQDELAENPTVEALIAASEAVLLTSVQEGFGLAYVEAAAARRPLIARRLPNIAPDLATFGFRFPHYYQEILIAPSLFDWRGEYDRQQRLFSIWKNQMPRTVAGLVEKPALLASGGNECPVPFSRLTLTAQMEVLAWPSKHSWDKCAPLNPFLASWQRMASTGRLKLSPWPAAAESWLGARAYAEEFFGLLQARSIKRKSPAASVAAQRQFLRTRLRSESLYPLLWGVGA